MSSKITSRSIGHLSKEISPALAVLLFAILFSYFLDPPVSLKGWEIIYRALFRFLRFTLVLCLPLYALSPIYGFVVDKTSGKLIQTEGMQDLYITPLKHWIFRPFQGIGIGLLFETKLLTALQIITGVTAKPFLLFPRGQFQLGRLLVTTGITVVISLLLSTLWTLDDAGIRYVNRKDQEMKMIGKYIGTLMPILFGFYGIFSLIGDFPTTQVINYLFKTVMILYPPFTVFTVLHVLFLKNREEYFAQRTPLRKGGIWYGSESVHRQPKKSEKPQRS
jgi:hypothetical protein